MKTTMKNYIQHLNIVNGDGLTMYVVSPLWRIIVVR